MPYRSEAAFSRQLCVALRKRLSLVQRIESGETGRGIPDLYIVHTRHAIWVELKNMPRVSVYNQLFTIPWRPGQLAWAYQYARAMQRPVYTVCALKDGFLLIPVVMFKGYIVHQNDCVRCTQLKDVVDLLCKELQHDNETGL